MTEAQWRKKDQGDDSGELKLDHQFSSGEKGTSHWPHPLPASLTVTAALTNLKHSQLIVLEYFNFSPVVKGTIDMQIMLYH